MGTPVATGREPADVAADSGGVWVANAGADSVWRFDPETRSVRARIAVGDEPRAVSVGAGGVWVANIGDRTITRIDPETNRVQGAPISLGKEIQDVVATGRGVWVSAADGTVTRLDPTTGQTVGQPLSPARAPLALAEDGDTLWAVSASRPDADPDRGGRREDLEPGNPLGAYVSGAPRRRRPGERWTRVRARGRSPGPAHGHPAARRTRSSARRPASACAGAPAWSIPRLPPVYGAGEQDGRAWLASRAILGRPLAAAGPLAPEASPGPRPSCARRS